jgi:hypothetical protein
LVGRRIDIKLNARVSLRRIVVALSFSPVGSRNKASLAIDALLDGEAASLTRKVIELAKAGDMQARKLCMDRIVLPPARPSSEFLAAEDRRTGRRRNRGCRSNGRCGGRTYPDGSGRVAKLLDV